MKHKSDVPGQLALFAMPTAASYAPTVEQRTTIHDPYWDEILAPQQEETEQRWNPSDFGEVDRKVDDRGQVSIFYEDSDEPPDPDDFKNLIDYHQAWDEWELRVGAQVTSSTVETTVQTRVGAQVTVYTKKTAPQHDTHWVERYWVERSGNKYWYYRYSWMVGRKKNRIYIGSVNSNKARRKKESVEIAIADGQSSSEIKHLIQGSEK